MPKKKTLNNFINTSVVTIFIYFILLAALQGMCDFSSPSGGGTHAPCTGNAEC